MSDKEKIWVEVAYVSDGVVQRRPLEVPSGSTVAETLRLASGLIDSVQLASSGVSVFGRRRPMDEPVSEGDRIELLGPLVADPKVARQRRVAKSRSQLARDRWRGAS
jgi:putative ubiquitin-RnfH superfamily antitoxin RatB of RatAB toxin-antitoxin module